MQAADASNRYRANHCGASARQREWRFSVVGVTPRRGELAAAFCDFASDSLHQYDRPHPLFHQPKMAARLDVQRGTADHFTQILAGVAGAETNRRTGKRRSYSVGICVSRLVQWCFAVVDHFFTAMAYTHTHSVAPKSRKCATQSCRWQHAGCARRNTFPAFTAVTVPVSKHDIEGDTYSS